MLTVKNETQHWTRIDTGEIKSLEALVARGIGEGMENESYKITQQQPPLSSSFLAPEPFSVFWPFFSPTRLVPGSVFVVWRSGPCS